ncbi:MAG: YtxH domain-containing protein [Atopobium sp.]|uniref:YtxH domain-containing protein n=1 Tax=Atopobium sp. TaxID=1872650 RepID=UPI002A819528|nr:YtxH domain-containing protein [Atopobium sp.]MDY4523098.1 YtxH domain-containing protein [Atopobium sp.]
MSKKSGFGFVLGTVFGATIGTVAGLMLAPRSGAESRAMAADAMNDAWDSAKDAYEVTSQNTAEKVAHIRPVVDATTDELRAKVDAARERMDQVRNSLSDTVAVASVQAQDVISNIASQVNTVVTEASTSDSVEVEAQVEKTDTAASNDTVA